MQPNQISQTAAFIAIKFYGLTRIEPYRSWFDEDIIQFYDKLVRFLPPPLNWYHRMLQKGWIRKFFIFSEELMLPGDLMHIIMRKYFIGQKVEQLLLGGYDQLLVLGAGFDHLAVLQAQNEIPSFEIDAPRMSSIKKAFIKQQELQHPDLHIVDYHFSAKSSGIDLQQIKNLDPGKDTVVVAEGFFDYLSQKQSKKILEDLVTFFKNKATLISTIFALDELSVVRRGVFKAGVSIVGEKIRLNASKTGFESLLTSANFNNIQMLDSDAMRENLLVPADIGLPVLDGFYLSFSEK